MMMCFVGHNTLRLAFAVILLSGVQTAIGARTGHMDASYTKWKKMYDSASTKLSTDKAAHFGPPPYLIGYQGVDVYDAKAMSDDDDELEDDDTEIPESALISVKDSVAARRQEIGSLGIAAIIVLIAILVCAAAAIYFKLHGTSKKQEDRAVDELAAEEAQIPTTDAEAAGPIFQGVTDESRPHEKPRKTEEAKDDVSDVEKAMQPEMSMGLRVSLKPGSIGISYADWKTGEIKDVESSGQAAQMGVTSGMIIKEIDGQPYTEELLDHRLSGKQEYEVVLVPPPE